MSTQAALAGWDSKWEHQSLSVCFILSLMTWFWTYFLPYAFSSYTIQIQSTLVGFIYLKFIHMPGGCAKDDSGLCTSCPLLYVWPHWSTKTPSFLWWFASAVYSDLTVWCKFSVERMRPSRHRNQSDFPEGDRDPARESDRLNSTNYRYYMGNVSAQVPHVIYVSKCSASIQIPHIQTVLTKNIEVAARCDSLLTVSCKAACYLCNGVEW